MKFTTLLCVWLTTTVVATTDTAKNAGSLEDYKQASNNNDSNNLTKPRCTLACRNGGICKFEREEDESLVADNNNLGDDNFPDANVWGSMRCHCASDWMGGLCERSIINNNNDNVNASPVVSHSMSEQDKEAYYCQSDKNPCKNGSTCHYASSPTGVPKISCDCSSVKIVEGVFVGQYCQDQANEICVLSSANGSDENKIAAAESYCVHGTCKSFILADDKVHPSCNCDKGFMGDRCDIAIASSGVNPAPMVDPLADINVVMVEDYSTFKESDTNDKMDDNDDWAIVVHDQMAEDYSIYKESTMKEITLENKETDDNTHDNIVFHSIENEDDYSNFADSTTNRDENAPSPVILEEDYSIYKESTLMEEMDNMDDPPSPVVNTIKDEDYSSYKESTLPEDTDNMDDAPITVMGDDYSSFKEKPLPENTDDMDGIDGMDDTPNTVVHTFEDHSPYKENSLQEDTDNMDDTLSTVVHTIEDEDYSPYKGRTYEAVDTPPSVVHQFEENSHYFNPLTDDLDDDDNTSGQSVSPRDDDKYATPNIAPFGRDDDDNSVNPFAPTTDGDDDDGNLNPFVVPGNDENDDSGDDDDNAETPDFQPHNNENDDDGDGDDNDSNHNTWSFNDDDTDDDDSPEYHPVVVDDDDDDDDKFPYSDHSTWHINDDDHSEYHPSQVVIDDDDDGDGSSSNSAGEIAFLTVVAVLIPCVASLFAMSFLVKKWKERKAEMLERSTWLGRRGGFMDDSNMSTARDISVDPFPRRSSSALNFDAEITRSAVKHDIQFDPSPYQDEEKGGEEMQQVDMRSGSIHGIELC